MQAAFDHLGVAATNQVIHQVVGAHRLRNGVGRSPGQEGAQSFFRKGIAGDWKSALQRDEIDDINAVCGAMMHRKKYRAV